MSRLLWNKALATPNHQWYVALPTRVPIQPPRFYHEAGKVNFVDPPAMASAVVSRGLGMPCLGDLLDSPPPCKSSIMAKYHRCLAGCIGFPSEGEDGET